MLKASAAVLLLMMGSGAIAQTTPTNPDILSPPVSAATPGGAANPSDTGTAAAAVSTKPQDATSQPTAANGAATGKRHQRPR